MPKPEYTESCSDCIHYTETSYMFGQCEACQNEVSCNAICTMFAERQISPEMCREAEKVPVVVEKAGTVTNGDMVREALSKLSDYKISHLEFCNLYDECDECPMNGMKKCMDTATARQLWLKQEAQNEQ